MFILILMIVAMGLLWWGGTRIPADANLPAWFMRPLLWLRSQRKHFIDECGQWYKLWSSWLAIAWGAITTLFWYNPELVPQIVGALPPEARTLLGPVVMGLVTGLPIFVRMLKQIKLNREKK